MKTAVIQIGSDNNKERNISKTLSLIQHAIARKAKFILLPEAFNFRGKIESLKGYLDIAEKIPGPSIVPLMDIAKRNRVAILAGSICEKTAGKNKVYNTSVLINSRGKIKAKYRKIHLFNAKIGAVKVEESRFFSKGSKPAVAKIKAWNAGMSICYDLRFPQLYQRYRKEGADILCVPSAFTKITGQAHWEVLLRARAIENVCYVLAPNQIGKDGKGVASYGNSMIIDPWGEILARASENREEVIFAELKKSVVREKREILGV